MTTTRDDAAVATVHELRPRAARALHAAVRERRLGSGRMLLEVTGEVDLATSAALAASLDRALAHMPAEVIVDLHGVRFMDSSGFAVLVRAARRLVADGGALTLRRARPQVRRLLALCGGEPALRVWV